MLLRQSQPTTLSKRHTIDKESAVIFGNIFQSTYCALFISRVVRILMHDRINHGMKQSAVIFPCISDNVSSTVKSVIYFVQQVARYDLWFPCSVHLDARQNQPQHEIVRWFFRAFQTTYHPPSRALFISCNKLHATMHDRITHGMLFNPFGYLRFCVTGCMRWGKLIYMGSK